MHSYMIPNIGVANVTQHSTSLLLKLDCYLCIYIYIYICNELIEETAGLRKLIFGMWESFGYGSSKF